MGSAGEPRPVTDSTASDVDPVREVERMHVFIQDWIGGLRQNMSPFTESLAEEFTFIPPSGTVLDREQSIAAMEDAGDAHADSSPSFRIDVQDAEVQLSVYGMHLVTYREHQRIDGEWHSRTSSVWLRETTRTATGLEWVHLHETWLESPHEDDEEADADEEDDSEEEGSSDEEADAADDESDDADTDDADTDDADDSDADDSDADDSDDDDSDGENLALG